MARVRRGFKARRRRNKIFKMAKGFHFDRTKQFKHTFQTVIRSLYHAYIGRKLKKRNMRGIWITRINAGAHTLGLSYSKFMGMMKKKGMEINRKMLSELAATDFDAFKAIVQAVK